MDELRSLDELSFEELSFEAPTLGVDEDEVSFDPLSDLGLSSFLSLSLSFVAESPLDPGEEDFFA